MTGLIHEADVRTPGEQRSETQKIYDRKVLERVKAGIAFLEKEHGPDWVEKIDMRTLNLANGSACVLGQVYYDEAEAEYREEYGEDPDDGEVDGYDYATTMFEDREGFSTAALGFCLSGDGDGWPALQAAWEDALTPIVKTR